eukprot:Rmarinus@m.29677
MTLSLCSHLRSTDPQKILSALNQIETCVRRQDARCFSCDTKMPNLRVCVTCAHMGCVSGEFRHVAAENDHNHWCGHDISIWLECGSMFCSSCNNEIGMPSGEPTHQSGEHAEWVRIIRSIRAVTKFSPKIPSQDDLKSIGSIGSVSEGSELEPNAEVFTSTLVPTARNTNIPGLANLGNTCYLNAAVQSLFGCEALVSHFLANRALWEGVGRSPRGNLTYSLGALLTHMWEGSDSSISPRDVVRYMKEVNPTFAGYMQQDSQEFLRTALDVLHEELRQELPFPSPLYQPQRKKSADAKENEPPAHPPKQYKSIVSDVFEGAIVSEVTCQECKKVSSKEDIFYELSISIPGKKLRARLAGLSVTDEPRAESSNGTSTSTAGNGYRGTKEDFPEKDSSLSPSIGVGQAEGSRGDPDLLMSSTGSVASLTSAVSQASGGSGLGSPSSPEEENLTLTPPEKKKKKKPLLRRRRDKDKSVTDMPEGDGFPGHRRRPSRGKSWTFGLSFPSLTGFLKNDAKKRDTPSGRLPDGVHEPRGSERGRPLPLRNLQAQEQLAQEDSDHTIARDPYRAPQTFSLRFGGPQDLGPCGIPHGGPGHVAVPPPVRGGLEGRCPPPAAVSGGLRAPDSYVQPHCSDTAPRHVWKWSLHCLR